MDRRSVTKILMGAVGFVAASAVAVPALLSALAPARRERRQPMWRAIGPLRWYPLGRVVTATVDMAPEGYPVKAVDAFSVYVFHQAPGEIAIFSRSCTDLGCPVNYDPGSEFYYCPCHGGVFNKSGQPVAGPPARPLYRYAARVRDRVLEIDLRSVPLIA